MRVHLVVNIHRPDAILAATEAAEWLGRLGFQVAVEAESGRFVQLPVVSAEEFATADLVIAFGGDGTLIRAAHLCAPSGTPILGVYYGRFGFVTQCKGGDLETCVQSFLKGELEVERRLMIEAHLIRGKQTIASLSALNEIVLQRDVSSRMMTFSVEVNGNAVTKYPADGVLISTPTGSTAYNMSAGGPIMDPCVEAIILTAMMPHTLSARTLVLGPSAEITLAVESDGASVLSADGQTRMHILSGDEVKVHKSPSVANLVVVEKHDFLIKLGQRMQWSHRLFEDVL